MSDEELYRLTLRVIRATQKMVEAQRVQISLFISILPALNVLTGRRKGTLEEIQALQESALQLEEAAFEMKCAWGDLLEIQARTPDFSNEEHTDVKIKTPSEGSPIEAPPTEPPAEPLLEIVVSDPLET
jgi:hypothetical protein